MSNATTLRRFTSGINVIEREQAPGSETDLWAEFCEWCRRTFGVLPYDDYEGDYDVQSEDRQWWLDLYANRGRA